MSKFLVNSRYMAWVGIVCLLLASAAAFGWGALKTFHVIQLVVETVGKDSAITIEFIELVDSLLISITLFIFSVSLYEMFIGDLSLPTWMIAHDLHELKSKLSSMIVLVMAVKFVESLFVAGDTADLLRQSAAISILSAVLIAFGYLGKKE